MALPEPHNDASASSVPLTRRQLREQERLKTLAVTVRAANSIDLSEHGSSATNNEAVVVSDAVVVSEAVQSKTVASDAVVSLTTANSIQDAGAVAPLSTAGTARAALARSSRALRALPRTAPRASRPARSPRKPKATARGIATFFIVPALFLTVALPAYASAPALVDSASAREQSLADAQSVGVASFANQISVARDAYSATTPEELAAAKAEAARVAAAEERAANSRSGSGSGGSGGGYSIVGQQSPGDDYPWWDQATDDQGGGLSPLRYYYRECVDFVAWRMNRDAGSYGAPFRWDWSNMASGSAYKWPSEWQRRGWMTSSTPVVGAVAAFPGGNHVAYVQSVNGDGTVSIEEYNWGNDHAYHTRTIPAADVPIYLYPPA